MGCGDENGLRGGGILLGGIMMNMACILKFEMKFKKMLFEKKAKGSFFLPD
jgi:hypothetical protein